MVRFLFLFSVETADRLFHCFTWSASSANSITSRHHDGRIWNRFKHMPRNTVGISCHGPRIIKHIYLDDTLHNLIAWLALCCPWGMASSMPLLAWAHCTNQPAIMLAFCRAHTQTGGKGLVLPLPLSHCEPVDSVHSEWGALSVHHLRRAN